MISEPFISFVENVAGGVDALEEGCFLIQRRRADRVDVPVRIWFGPPLDPETLEEMDRSPRWQIDIAGVPFDEPLYFGGMTISSLIDFWPACKREPIDRAEYDYRVARTNWAIANDPDDAFATVGGRIDPMTATLPGM